MTQKELLIYALHGINEKLKLRCAYVAEGSTNQKYIDAILDLIRDRSEIEERLMKEENA